MPSWRAAYLVLPPRSSRAAIHGIVREMLGHVDTTNGPRVSVPEVRPSAIFPGLQCSGKLRMHNDSLTQVCALAAGKGRLTWTWSSSAARLLKKLLRPAARPPERRRLADRLRTKVLLQPTCYRDSSTQPGRSVLPVGVPRSTLPPTMTTPRSPTLIV